MKTGGVGGEALVYKFAVTCEVHTHGFMISSQVPHFLGQAVNLAPTCEHNFTKIAVVRLLRSNDGSRGVTAEDFGLRQLVHVAHLKALTSFLTSRSISD